MAFPFLPVFLYKILTESFLCQSHSPAPLQDLATPSEPFYRFGDFPLLRGICRLFFNI